MLTRSKASSPAPTRSKSDLRVIAFNRNRQAILRQLGMLLLFGLSLLNSLLWTGAPLGLLMVDMGLTLLAGTWVVSRYFAYGSKPRSQR